MSAGRTAHGLHYSVAGIERARRLVCADENRTARHTWLATGTSGQAPFSVSLPAISRHLKVLERASLTTRPTGGLDSRSASGSPTVWRPSEQGWLESFTKLDATLAA